jgi:hypothetical protein
MANSDKNIIITPNIGQSGQPSFSFIGAGNSSVTLKALDDSLGTISFQNSGSGQIFGLDTNITGLTRNNGSIFRVNDNNGFAKLSVNTNFNTAVDICPGDGQVRVHRHNYIESACYTITSASRNTIVSNNSGYVQFEIANDPAYFCTNQDIMQIVDTGNYGLRFTKPGVVTFGMSQDIIGSSTSSYMYASVYVNGNIKGNHLITNSNGQWDSLYAFQTVRVNANEVLQLFIGGSGVDITAIDVGSWSYYSFLFNALPF